MNMRHRVELHQSEREEPMAPLSGGKQPSRRLKRARILLAADKGAADAGIAERVVCGISTTARTRRRLVEGNLATALFETPRPGAARKPAGREEALPVATACSNPPVGRARRTLELSSDEPIRLTEHRSLSRETVRRRLPACDLKPWRKDMWCMSGACAAFVAAMRRSRSLQ